jgi:hypothetical protein
MNRNPEKKETKAKSLFTLEQIADFFKPKDHEWKPPYGNQRQKELNMIMAAALMLGTYDEMSRRTEVDVSDLFSELRDNVEKMNHTACGDLLVRIILKMTGMNEKLLPVNIQSITAAALVLLDNGMAKPPEGMDVSDKIRINRSMMIAMATSMAKLHKGNQREGFKCSYRVL